MQALLQSASLSFVLGLIVVLLSAIMVVQLMRGGTIDPEITRLFIMVIGLLTAHTNIAAVLTAKSVSKVEKQTNGLAEVVSQDTTSGKV